MCPVRYGEVCPRLRENVTAYFREHGISLNDWQEDLARNMFALNIVGVENRYGKGEAAQFRDLNFTYTPVVPPADIQALKTLNCWLYRCDEGTIPDHPLYRFFDAVVVRHLLEKIVYHLPAYDKATWG
jgi:hypothetical protein